MIHENLLPVSVLVEVVALEPDDDEGHDRLHHAELKRRLWKERYIFIFRRRALNEFKERFHNVD